MKLKRKNLKYIVKYVISWGLLLAIAFNLPLLSVFADVGENSSDIESAYNMHQYHEGIVDGGVYYLRNAGNNGYLTADNGSASMFTTLSTSTLTYATHQQFRMEYMGSDIYRIVARHTEGSADMNAVDGKMYICAEWRESGDLISIYGVSEFWGGYRLESLGDNKFIILTEASGFTCAVTINTSNSNQLIQKTYNSMTAAEKQYAQWFFENADSTEYSSYSKFYIRNDTYDVYLDASAPSLFVLQAAPFSGAEAQQWKQTNTSINDRYFLSPMRNLYYYIGTYNNDIRLSLITHNEAESYRQHLELEYAGLNNKGQSKYRIAIYMCDGSGNLTSKKYLNMGSLVEGSNDTYEIVYSNKTSGNDVWVFEATKLNVENPNPLTLNQWSSNSMFRSQGNVCWFKIPVNKTARYKVELSGNNVVIGSIQGVTPMTELNRKTYNGLKIVDVFLYNLNIDSSNFYYIPVVYTGTNSNTNISFQIRVRQLSFVGHSDDDCGGPNGNLYMSGDMDAIQDSLLDMNFHFTHNREITATQALSSTDLLTGYSDFNVEIFAYAGHGSPGQLIYEIAYGTNGSDDVLDLFNSSSLPDDMSNCELVVWNCCYSALDEPDNDPDGDGVVRNSMTRESIKRDARTVIGFSAAISNSCARYFIDSLFEELSKGYTVQRATINAKASLLNWADYQAAGTTEKALILVEHMQIWGDPDNIIFPREEIDTNLIASANDITMESVAVFNRSEYTLMLDSPASGIKKYVKMIDGIPTDDYYIEFYDSGKLVKTYKSRNMLTEAEVLKGTIDLAQVFEVKSNTQLQNIGIETLVFTHVNGELCLLRQEVTVPAGHCACEAEYVFYNAKTNEVIS